MMDADDVRIMLERLMERAETRHAAALSAAHAERDAEHEANRKLSRAAFVLKGTSEAMLAVLQGVYAMEDRNEPDTSERMEKAIVAAIDEIEAANSEIGIEVTYSG